MAVTIKLRSLMWCATAVSAGAVGMWMFLSAWSAEAAPGDLDTTVVPITSCRLADTRPASQIGPRGAALGADETYVIDVQDSSTECAGRIPVEATGVVLNVTADQTTQLTFLTVWDSGPWPGTSSMNPTAGPPVPNAVTTKLDSDQRFRIYNAYGSTHVVIDIVAYLTPDSLRELDDRVDALEAEVDALQAKLAAVEMLTVDGRPTVRFSGVNVQIVDGSGDSQCSVGSYETCNGAGNLIVGYNEGVGGEQRSGSHNIVGGINNDWTSYSGLVVGWTNTISGSTSTVTGGSFNEASGGESTVSGGRDNTASGTWSSVSGGTDNDSTGFASSVVGGRQNEASGQDAVVTSGEQNLANGPQAAVSGGKTNVASGDAAAVTAGAGNFATGPNASVSGGSGNFATGLNAVVVGGVGNTASGQRTVIAGGDGCLSNTVDGVFVGDTSGIACTQLN
ncbi:MAG: hypothetical protein HKN44_05765 [Ilumatobacter sp.]|nr:hypothetical protein [Ilumatobacter sp.]